MVCIDYTSVKEIYVAVNGATHFSCVASAAHFFIIVRRRKMKSLKKVSCIVLAITVLLSIVWSLSACQSISGVQGEQGVQGIQGEQGDKGDQGDKGEKGEAGKSAYDIAVENGFTGTEVEWLELLKGEKGEQGEKGEKGDYGGPKGDKGDDGRGILKVEIIENHLWITYSDAPASPVDLGTIQPTYNGTDGLDFYPLPDGTYGVMAGKTQYLEDIEIPAAYNEKAVTMIFDNAFKSAKNLKSITIPNSVTSIGEYAFEDCTGLTEITISDSVTSIGKWAFSYCTGLTEITIPDSVTSIGYGAFYNCTGLTEITIPNSVTSIGASAFSVCTGLIYNEYNNAYYLGNQSNPYLVLIKAKDTSITSCKINSNTRFICSDAFYDCIGLTEIIIPDSVTSIGEYAFSCSGITSITIGSGVASIGWRAFEYSNNLASVTFKNPNGWSADGTSISNSDLSNATTAAKYLKKTYCDYDWNRS